MNQQSSSQSLSHQTESSSLLPDDNLSGERPRSVDGGEGIEQGVSSSEPVPSSGPSLPSSPSSPLPVIRIQPSRGALRLDELWEYRELLYFLVWRDIKVQYKQTVLGAAWAIIQPFFSMVIFSLVFGKVAGIPSDDIPYPVFSFAALVPWTFFANGLNKSTQSLVTGSNIVKKVYFPRLIMPISAVLSGVVDFMLAFLMLLGIMAFFGILPTANIVWLPFLLVLGASTSLGVGLWLSAMNVEFRDVRYVIPFLVQAWMYASPIVYPSSMFGEPWRTLYALNPMVGVIEGFRWALLGTETQPALLIIVSTLSSLALLVSGMVYFRRMEKNFADVL
jgi:lipopolysaccharide transport system permease protein